MAFDFGYIVCRSLSLGLTPFFRSYNNTAYCGPETHILNSYTNPSLWAMHGMLPTNNSTVQGSIVCRASSVPSCVCSKTNTEPTVYQATSATWSEVEDVNNADSATHEP